MLERLLFAGIAAGLALSAAPGRAATGLTIYSTATPGAVQARLYRPVHGRGQDYGQDIPGYAMVRQQRNVSLAGSRSSVRFTDVAALIDPSTVSFISLTDPQGTHVLAQDYQFDLVSADKLLERYLDREITVEQAHGDTIETVTGILLGTSDGLVLRERDGRIRILRGWSNIRFPELPGGLITRPTLVWDISTGRQGDHLAEVSYQTGGITWWADYNLVYTQDSRANRCRLDVGSWVSIVNRSGASYGDAKLKLVAGDVHRAPQPEFRLGRGMPMLAMAEDAAARGFAEKGFFEYHLYTLGRPVTLPDNSTKQLELFPTAAGVGCSKDFVYSGTPGHAGVSASPRTDRNFGVQSNGKVDIYLRFANEKGNGLGIPLPSGRVRVNKRDPDDGALEFIGEDSIDHTPKDEEVMIKLGSAFDITGERRQADFRVDQGRRWMEETIEVRLRNHKQEAVQVIIKENLYRWSNWRITDETVPYEKADARTIHFPVTVGKDAEAVVSYTVRYTW